MSIQEFSLTGNTLIRSSETENTETVILWSGSQNRNEFFGLNRCLIYTIWINWGY